MSDEYEFIMFAACLDSGLEVGNALALAIGHNATGPAFGGDPGVPLRPIGSGDTTPTAWATWAILRSETNDLVQEFNTAGPYTLLGALGVSEPQIAAGKAVLVAESFSRSTHEYGFIPWLASKGYEAIV